jgi:hypothetical protein
MSSIFTRFARMLGTAVLMAAVAGVLMRLLVG